MDTIRSWSYSRPDSADVWDWESGDFEASDWPLPETGADVTYEDGGYRVLVRGVIHTPPHAEALPRRVAADEDGLHLELEEVREDVDGLIPDVEVHRPYEVVVEFDDRTEEADLPRQTVVEYYRNETPFFRTAAER
ncbi:hypothetical protein [Halopiger xanaduensis]|uniref:Uncharacterized protein n=1 Tax=Halopiger xanaduensis (strain DSM 18323 / JCM 14033 / SH-6) TaxID=797210 RepID=F8DBN5_HALXS|nr:hypothetical protein [Halopiger xanaduensis]AEH38302.1 hypothetical protein Halxa_3695 [Halopiger xanaduensis SH-6]